MTERTWAWSVAYLGFSRMLEARGHSTEWVKGKRCLDIGLGDAQNTAIMAFLEASSVVAIDRDAMRVREARRLLHGVPSVDLVHADAEDLPFPDGSFDCIVCLRVLHHSAQTHRITGELGRVLGPGGELFLHQHF